MFRPVLTLLVALVCADAVPVAAQSGEWRARRGGATAARRPATEPAAKPAAAEEDSVADLELLRSAGIGTGAAGLMAFLEKGPPQKLPGDFDAGQLAVEAMARLAELRHRPAVPLLARIATGDLPPGLVALLEQDLATVSPRSREEIRTKGARVFRINAVTALGWLGDQRAIEAVRAAMAAEPNTALRLQIALAQAMLGDPSGLDFVVQVIGRGNRKEAAAAAAVFKSVVGEDFGITDQTPVKGRRARAPLYARHWKAIRAQFRPDREAILKRRKALANPPKYEPRTTVDYLKMAANYLDLNDARGSRTAREYLAQAGSTLNAELQRIAMDEEEDLDVRMEAMNWLYQNLRQKAHPLLRSLKRDENPEIADKAESLLTAPLDPLGTNYVFPKQ